MARLKAYKARLILFPKKGGKADSGESVAEAKALAKGLSIAASLPFVGTAPGFYEVKKADAPKPIEGGAYHKLRTERSDARLVGVREKRAKEKAEAEANKK